jgi:hypothetical protein
LGQYEAARPLIECGLRIQREVDEQWGIALAVAQLGYLALAQGAYAEARRRLGESAAVLRALEVWSDIGWRLALLSAAELGLREVDQAQQYLCQALQLCDELRDALTPRFALPCSALYIAYQGRPERAVEVYALACRYPDVANSCAWEDAVGRHVAAAAQDLPPEVVSAAQERGRSADLWETVEALLEELGCEGE